MGRKSRLAGGLTVIPTLVVSMLAATIAAGASAGARTYVIGVDNATPSGRNFEYVDFFPRGLVSGSGTPTVVGNGATIDFKWIGTGDTLHTATVLPVTTTPDQAWQQFPLITVDADDIVPGSVGPPPLAANNSVFFPNVGCGGSADSACPNDFFVRVNLPTATPTTVQFICLIHPGMQGTVKVVPGEGSSPSAVSDNAAAQYASDTAGALAAAAQASATAA